jgi:phenylalanyl-tRNA synthetase beta chain
MKPFEYKKKEKIQLGIARVAEIHTQGEMDADLHYKIATIDSILNSFLLQLRLEIVGTRTEQRLANILAYTMHTTGVVLRAYDSRAFRNGDDKISVLPVAKAKGVIEITGNSQVFSVVGANQDKSVVANDETKELLIEASYINPDTLVEAVAGNSLERDELYYKTSRGSNPDLDFGLTFLASMMNALSDIACYEGSLRVSVARENETVVVNTKEISSIVGMDIEIGKIVTILQKLGFGISAIGHDAVAVRIPFFRHDVKHIQDISEEIVRIIGINNIKAKPFVFAEKPRLNDTTQRYQAKKEFKNRSVGASFYENVSYVFTEKALLVKYGFAVVEEALDLVNPIAEELNTLRSTILINLLNATKRNVSYTKKSIPLFEMGAVFGSRREQSEVMSFVFSGQVEGESVKNSGKPKMIDFASFVQKVAAVTGTFELVPCTAKNRLIHPYQSADIMLGSKVCGFISKLHPTAQEYFDVPVTFIAEVNLDAFLPKHVNATPVSKFQGVYKDLSVVIDKSLGYYEVAKVLNSLHLPMLKDSYPVDIYEDEKLGDKKSLTIRFFIQSMDKTLEENDIESLMSQIMISLEKECNAELR